ncbi:MAG: MATE family efflux transporter [Ruminococcaceae bacterium]|nr:MATE family efflux transporter [Oscillospiraceae bacterium]
MNPTFKKSSNNLSELLTVTTSLGSLNLIKLAIPLFFEYVFNFLITTVSAIVLSGHSQDAFNAALSAGKVITLLIVFLSGISAGGSILVSNLIGAERIEKVKKACLSIIMLLTGIGVVFTVLLFAAAPSVADWLNLTGPAYELSIVYMRIRAMELTFKAVYTVLIALMRCYGYTKIAVTVGIITNVLNLLFSIYAVYYATVPFLSGVSGVAVGSALSQIVGCGIAIIMFRLYKIKIAFPDGFKEFFEFTKRALYLGIPTCIANGSYNIAQIITTSFASGLHEDVLTAKGVLDSIVCYSYVFGMSVAMANSLLIGRLCGAGNYEHARRLNKALVKFTVPANALVAILIILFRKPLLSLFTDNQSIITMALGILFIDIIAEVARGISHIHEAALRAANDVTLTMVVTIVSGWVFSVGLGYILAVYCNMGLMGFWIALVADEIVRAVYTYLRWKSNRWTTKIKV